MEDAWQILNYLPRSFKTKKEQSLVNANKELITLFEQKIKDKIASVWGEDK